MKGQFAVGIVKIVDYLLNPDHPDGGSKAKFLIDHGFSAADPTTLADALLQHQHLEPAAILSNRWGTRFVVDGPISAPDGRTPRLRTVWQTSNRHDPVAQLVTAYPLR